MKRSDLLKIILGFLLGGIGLMLYKAFTVPDMPELASSSNLVVERGGTATLIVEVEDGCTANWYTQEIGGEPFQKNAITYKEENLQNDATYYVEAVSEKNARKVSKKRRKIEVKVKEQIAEIPATEQGQGEEPHEHEAPPVEPPAGPEPINDDQDNDGIKDEFDECETVKGVRELNGCPYEKIDLSIAQNTNDHNYFSFNSKIWNAISDNSLTFEFTCDCKGLNNYPKPIVVVQRGQNYGRFFLDSDNRYVGAKGTVRVKDFTKYKKYQISGESSSFTEKLSCSSQGN